MAFLPLDSRQSVFHITVGRLVAQGMRGFGGALSFLHLVEGLLEGLTLFKSSRG